MSNATGNNGGNPFHFSGNATNGVFSSNIQNNGNESQFTETLDALFNDHYNLETMTMMMMGGGNGTGGEGNTGIDGGEMAGPSGTSIDLASSLVDPSLGRLGFQSVDNSCHQQQPVLDVKADDVGIGPDNPLTMPWASPPIIAPFASADGSITDGQQCEQQVQTGFSYAVSGSAGISGTGPTMFDQPHNWSLGGILTDETKPPGAVDVPLMAEGGSMSFVAHRSEAPEGGSSVSPQETNRPADGPSPNEIHRKEQTDEASEKPVPQLFGRPVKLPSGKFLSVKKTSDRVCNHDESSMVPMKNPHCAATGIRSALKIPPAILRNQQKSAGSASVTGLTARAGYGSSGGGMASLCGKRPLSSLSSMSVGFDSSAISEDEGERERRRQDRNIREQKRSQQIVKQIAELGEVLTESNVPFKPDKYSTLSSAVEYLKQLQDRSEMLDSEHKKLLDTVSQTTKLVNDQYISANDTTMGVGNHPGLRDLVVPRNEVESAGSLDQPDARPSGLGIDFKYVFLSCPFPLAITSLDGRFLDCNKEFEQVSGFSRSEMLPLEEKNKASSDPKQQDSGVTAAVVTTKDGTASATVTNTGQFLFHPQQERNMSLFHILVRNDMERVFAGMSGMIRLPFPSEEIGEEAEEEREGGDFWTDKVQLSRRPVCETTLNVSVVRTPKGSPRFFSCALVISGDD